MEERIIDNEREIKIKRKRGVIDAQDALAEDTEVQDEENYKKRLMRTRRFSLRKRSSTAKTRRRPNVFGARGRMTFRTRNLFTKKRTQKNLHCFPKTCAVACSIG